MVRVEKYRGAVSLLPISIMDMGFLFLQSNIYVLYK